MRPNIFLSLIFILVFINQIASQESIEDLKNKGYDAYEKLDEENKDMEDLLNTHKYLFAYLQKNYENMQDSGIEKIENIIAFCEIAIIEKQYAPSKTDRGLLGKFLGLFGSDDTFPPETGTGSGGYIIVRSGTKFYKAPFSDLDNNGIVVTSGGNLIEYHEDDQGDIVINFDNSIIDERYIDLYRDNAMPLTGIKYIEGFEKKVSLEGQNMQRAVQSESIIDLAKQVSVSSQQIGTELDQLRAVGFPTEKDLQAYDTVLGSIAEQQKALSELHTMIELQALEQGMIQR